MGWKPKENPFDQDLNTTDSATFDSVTTDVIQFDLAPSVTPEEGMLYWDPDKSTLNLVLAGGTVMQIAQEQVLPDKPRNVEVTQIDNGQVVYLSGGTGSVPEVQLANAGGQLDHKAVAVATQDVKSNARGYYTTFGLVRDIDTSFGSDGDEVFLDSTDGGLTTTKLDHPYFRIKIGYIIRSHATEGVLFVSISGDEWLKRFQSAGLIWGFDYDNSNLRGDVSFTDGTRTFEIAPKGGQDYFNYWIKGKEYRKTSAQSVVIGDTTDLHFIYFDGSTLTSSTTPWGFDDDYAFVAVVYWNSTQGEGILQEERHMNNMPRSVHKYLHETVSMRYESGLAGTFNDNGSFTITAGEVHDEDLEHDISQQTTCNLFYRDASLDWSFDKANSKFYVETADVIQYDNAGTLTDVPNSSFVSSYVFASNDQTNPIWVIIGQRTDTNIANAQANQTPDTLSLGTLPSPEMKLLYQVIIKRTATSETVEDTIDYRKTSLLPSGGFVGVDHGGLSGLADDDHKQYALLAGRSGDKLVIDELQYQSATGLIVYDENGVKKFEFDGSNLIVYESDAGNAALYLQGIAEGGRITVLQNGSSQHEIFGGTDTVFNEQGLDRNFRIETVGQTHMLFLDGGLNRIGVRKSDPDVPLDVDGSIRASDGILFGTDTAAVNTLDDYEEGTWTPVITDTTNNATMDGTTTGTYTKIGNTVFLRGFVYTSSLGSVSGAIYISGLPFTVNSGNAGYSGVGVAMSSGLNITAGQSVSVLTMPGTTRLQLKTWDATTGTTNMQATEWTADGSVAFSLNYIIE